MGIPDGLREKSERFVLLAETFSGPVPIKLAATQPPGLVGLILVGSFLKPMAKVDAHLIRSVDVTSDFLAVNMPVTQPVPTSGEMVGKSVSNDFINTRYIVLDAPHLILQRAPR